MAKHLTIRSLIAILERNGITLDDAMDWPMSIFMRDGPMNQCVETVWDEARLWQDHADKRSGTIRLQTFLTKHTLRRIPEPKQPKPEPETKRQAQHAVLLSAEDVLDNGTPELHGALAAVAATNTTEH